MRLFIITYLCLSFLSFSFAKDKGVDGLLLWKMHKDVPAQIIPVRTGETKVGAAQRYLKTLQIHPELKKLFNNSTFDVRMVNFDNIEFLDIDEVKHSKKVSILLLSNYLNDLVPKYWRPLTFIRPLRFFGANTFMLAPAADVGLSRKDAVTFRKMVITTFDAILSLGGDDVHPALYGEKVTYSYLNQINLARDKAELRMIRAFNKEERGVFYGICRGSQLCAVERGGKLIQDLKQEQKVVQDHWLKIHELNIDSKSKNILNRFVSDPVIDILSAHHQALVPGTAKVKPIAFYGKGSEFVVEGWQLPNNLGLGLQFHPELFAENSDNEKILKGMVQYASFIKSQRKSSENICKQSLKRLLDRNPLN